MKEGGGRMNTMNLLCLFTLGRAFLACGFAPGCNHAEDGCVQRDLSTVAIVGPSEARGSNGLAVDELRYHLSVVSGSKISENGNALFRFVFAKPADGRDPEPYESRYRIDGNTVWFWGDDAGPTMTWRLGEKPYVEPKIHNGTLFAVELFAENELGVRWVWPGEDGMVFKKRSTFSWPKFKEASFVSPLAKAEFRAGGAFEGKRFPYDEVRKFVPGLPAEILSMDDYRGQERLDERRLWRLRMRLQDREHIRYGHAFTDWKKRFLNTHPEYLNLKDGERGNTRGSRDDFVHLCVSNEAVVDQIIADWLRGGTNRYLNVCENDGSSTYCECQDCTRYDVPLPVDGKVAHKTDRYVQFWNRIAGKAVAIRPDVMLVAYIYSEYRLPPRREKVLHPDNILLGAVPSIMDDTDALFRGWRAAGARKFFLRPNHHHFLGAIPRGLERYLFENMKEAISYGAIGFDYDAPANRLPNNLEYYVTGKMLTNPNMDFAGVCEEYYSAYGAAAKEVREYFEAVRRDGERARSLFIANGERLDHSQLAMGGGNALQAYGRNEDELRSKLKILECALKAHSSDLTALERRRLESLALQARHAVVTFRFLSAKDLPQEEFWKRSRELLAFRKAHYRDLPDCYGAVFRKWWGEVQTWKLLKRPKGWREGQPGELNLEQSL